MEKLFGLVFLIILRIIKKIFNEFYKKIIFKFKKWKYIDTFVFEFEKLSENDSQIYGPDHGTLIWIADHG